MSKNSDLHRTKKDFQSTGEGDKKKGGGKGRFLILKLSKK